MTQIIEYRTRNKGRASPGAECASASGNLGTIALVNSQFLFWLVSKGTSKPPFCTVFTKGRKDTVTEVHRDSPFCYRSLLDARRKENGDSASFASPSRVINLCRGFLRDLSRSPLEGSSLSFTPPVISRSIIRLAHPFTVLLRSGSETSQGNRILRSRALLNPTARACRGCTVKFVIGASIVALSTVRRKCRFSLSLLLSSFFPPRLVRPSFKRSRFYSLARLFRGSF